MRCSEGGRREEHEEPYIYRIFVYGLLCSLSMPLLDSLRVTSSSTAGEGRMIVLHEDIHLLLRRLCESVEEGFSVDVRLSQM